MGSLVLDHPGLADLLGRLGLDFCCQGNRTLAAACEEHDLDVDTVVRLLEAADESRRAGHAYDPRRAPTAALCDHIVAEHHEPLRLELPRLEQTAATVVRVHGADDPRLATLAAELHHLGDELVAHFDREEAQLFPACIAAEADAEPAARDALLDELEDDHADVGDALRRVRELADDYRLETARCGTHRLLLESLTALEQDLHTHIHEENNVLFPRVRGLLAAGKEQPR
ncbi:MAG TPA: iron-sulfur cluster repair di-iron protein [Gaiellaceae bacterium]|nr:iron-sulfur cluster repair di-iron protein [Gaiellaceae bacterium]